MDSFFSVQQQRNTFKVGSAYAITIWFVITFLVAAPPTFADEEKEINNPKLHNSVAVLPFENKSPNPDDAYFAVGIHEQILDRLTKIRDIRPISRPSILIYEGTEKSVAEIASATNVETIMKGSVRYADNKINIAVQLLDASNNKQLWSEIYEGDLSEIFALQVDIVEHIVLALGADITAAEQVRIEKAPTNSLEAYLSYMKARILVDYLVPGAPPEFYQYLDQAIALDPNFALAHAVTACIYELALNAGFRLNNLTEAEMEELAIKHANVALAVDPDLGMANWAQALIHFSNQLGTETIQAYKSTLELRPNDVHILDEYARFLTYIGGRDEEAIRLSQYALALAPNEALWHARFGRTLMFAGNPSDAVDVFRKGIKLSPYKYSAHAFLGMVYIILGNETEGLKELRIAEEQLIVEEQLSGKIRPFSICRLAYYYSILGYHEDAVRLVKRIEKLAADGQYLSSSLWIISYLAIGEVDKAYNVLKQNPNEGISPLQVIQSNVMKNPVLEEPRFVELRKKIGF